MDAAGDLETLLALCEVLQAAVRAVHEKGTSPKGADDAGASDALPKRRARPRRASPTASEASSGSTAAALTTTPASVLNGLRVDPEGLLAIVVELQRVHRRIAQSAVESERRLLAAQHHTDAVRARQARLAYACRQVESEVAASRALLDTAQVPNIIGGEDAEHGSVGEQEYAAATARLEEELAERRRLQEQLAELRQQCNAMVADRRRTRWSVQQMGRELERLEHGAAHLQRLLPSTAGETAADVPDGAPSPS